MSKLEVPAIWVSIFTVLGVFAAIASLYLSIYWQISSSVEKRIDAKINSPEYIRKVAAEVRPSIVFDHEGKILHDGGGLKYIDSNIIFEKINDSKSEKGDYKISITSKIYLQSLPLLEPIDQTYVIKGKRGKGLKWVFNVFDVGISFGSKKHGGLQNRFRLEIIK